MFTAQINPKFSTFAFRRTIDTQTRGLLMSIENVSKIQNVFASKN